VLNARLGVHAECFASPLNCRFATHCSAFADTDRPFGSLGSFFKFTPDEGSFEANPPFEEIVMARCATHIDALLSPTHTRKALSFVVVVPVWKESAAWRSLSSSPHNRGVVIIAAADHGFCDGAAHQRRDR
jgi:phosphorylated CTD-interacting factor 1